MCLREKGGWLRKGGLAATCVRKKLRKGKMEQRESKREREQSGAIEDLLRSRGRDKVTEY